jgi:hypothetical protein
LKNENYNSDMLVYRKEYEYKYLTLNDYFLTRLVF